MELDQLRMDPLSFAQTIGMPPVTQEYDGKLV